MGEEAMARVLDEQIGNVIQALKGTAEVLGL
jgi:hypothetical protein